jgi:hypothetical protein
MGRDPIQFSLRDRKTVGPGIQESATSGFKRPLPAGSSTHLILSIESIDIEVDSSNSVRHENDF